MSIFQLKLKLLEGKDCPERAMHEAVRVEPKLLYKPPVS
jgi:hypothetical protein